MELAKRLTLVLVILAVIFGGVFTGLVMVKAYQDMQPVLRQLRADLDATSTKPVKECSCVPTVPEQKEQKEEVKPLKREEEPYGELAALILSRLGDRSKWDSDEKGTLVEKNGVLEVCPVSFPFMVICAGKNITDTLTAAERGAIYQSSFLMWRGIKREESIRTQREALEAIRKKGAPARCP